MKGFSTIDWFKPKAWF